MSAPLSIARSRYGFAVLRGGVRISSWRRDRETAEALKARLEKALSPEEQAKAKAILEARPPLVATQASPGGLWHAGREERPGSGWARSLCGREGWVDHKADGSPLPAALDPEDESEAQGVECLRCRGLMRAGA